MGSSNKNCDMRWRNVRIELPKHNDTVLIYTPYLDNLTMGGVKQFIHIAVFQRGKEIKGIPGEVITPYDQHGNNKVPYGWYWCNSGHWFGQEVSHWMYLPKAPVG